MPKGTKPAPPQQANLKEFWGKPKPKKKVEEAPVASGSGLKKEDTDDMQVDLPSHRDPKSTRPSRLELIISLNFSAQPKLRVLPHRVRVTECGNPCDLLSSQPVPPSPKSKKRRVDSDDEEVADAPGWLNAWIVAPPT